MKEVINIFFCFLIMTLISCQSGTKDKTNERINGQGGQKSITLPGLDIESYQNLLENCDFIDYIFHQLPFSMSQEDRASIVTNLRFISNQPVTILNPSCQSMARIIFSVHGEIDTEAELYFNQECTYFVFVKNEKPVAANLMTPEGVAFYNRILSQIKTSIPNEKGSGN